MAIYTVNGLIMLKLTITIIISGIVLLACIPQYQKGTFSVFEYKFESKAKLKELGFVQDSFKTSDNKKLPNANRYISIVKDTIVKLSFSETILLSKIIILKTNLIDTSVLLQSLYQKGFVKLSASDNFAKFDLLNSKINEHYSVYMNPKYITFENFYERAKNEIPNMDSIRTVKGK